jgi:hypothetical protein
MTTTMFTAVRKSNISEGSNLPLANLLTTGNKNRHYQQPINKLNLHDYPEKTQDHVS